MVGSEVKPFRTRLLVATLVALLLALGATPAAADSDGGKKDTTAKGKPVPAEQAAFPGDPGVPSLFSFPGDPGEPSPFGFPGDPGEPELD